MATGRWYGFDGGGFARFGGRQWTVFRSGTSSLPANDCTGLTLDSAGDLWVSTESGVARFDRITGWQVVSRSQTWFPQCDRDGHLWVGSSSGFIAYDGVKWKRWKGGQGPHQVQSRGSLSAGEWEEYGAPTDNFSLPVEIQGPARFFRVKETQP